MVSVQELAKVLSELPENEDIIMSQAMPPDKEKLQTHKYTMISLVFSQTLCTIFTILLTFLGKCCNAHMLHASGVDYSKLWPNFEFWKVIHNFWNQYTCFQSKFRLPFRYKMAKMMDLQKCQQNCEYCTQCNKKFLNILFLHYHFNKTRNDVGMKINTF